jgi:putative ABC transport system substrate-binding protein
MRRREFIALASGAVAWPKGVHAQQAAVPSYRLAVLLPLPEEAMRPFFDEMRQLGFEEGRNLVIDRRGFGVRYERFPALAAEMLKAGPSAFICAGDAAIRAAQTATSTIPIVAVTDDMVGSGLVRSLAMPGNNTTGVSFLVGDLDAKRQEILIGSVPDVHRIAALVDVQSTPAFRTKLLEDAAQRRGIALMIQRVERTDEIGPAIERAKTEGAKALNVLASPLLHVSRQVIIARTSALRLPAIYQWPDTAREGGLLAYGPSLSELMRVWARQVIKVLRGANPAGLAVEQPTKFELVINLKTAKALGVTIPQSLLLRADEVIQ